MKVFRSSPFRASILFLALASIGSTGCMTMMLVEKYQRAQENREAEAQWRHRVADLKRAAATGDPKARLELVDELAGSMNTAESGKPDLVKALAMLTESAGQDDGPAQRKLGEYLVDVRVPGFRTTWRDLRDHERGIYWLQRAATHGCRFKERGGTIDYDLAQDVADVMAASGRREDALAWRARSIIECRTRSAYDMLDSVREDSRDRAGYVDRLALLLLSQNADTIATARHNAPAADFAVAEQLAETVRPRLAAIQRDFPRRAPSTATSTDK